MKRLVILAIVALSASASAQPVGIGWRPPAGCTTDQVIKWNGSAWVCGTDSSVSDGDKTDITVSGTGATWTIDNDVVTYAKMQNVSATNRLLGRFSASAGDAEEISLSSDFQFSTGALDLSTAVTAPGTVDVAGNFSVATSKFTVNASTGATAITGLATTVKDVEIAKSSATAWHLTTRDTPTTFPAAVMRASQTNTVLAFDLMPNGTPSIGSGGYTWFDACDADLWANNLVSTHCARVGIDGYASFGSVAFNGATARGVRLHIDGTNKLEIQTTAAILSTTLSIAPSSGNAMIDTGLSQNTGTWIKTSNTNAGTGAYVKYEGANDGGTGVTDLFTFGTGYTTNGALMQDSSVLYSGAGLSGGLNLVSAHTSGAIRFYTGGFASGNKALEITTGGHLDATGTDPALSSCGTSPTIVGDDKFGTVTIGTGGSATACTITFAVAYTTNAPSCILTSQMSARTDLYLSAASTSAITVSNGAGAAWPASGKFSYQCGGTP